MLVSITFTNYSIHPFKVVPRILVMNCENIECYGTFF